MTDQATAQIRARRGVAARVERTINILCIVVIVVLAALIALWKIPSSYEILLPATAQPVNPMIYVGGHPPASGRGRLLMTFVSEPESNKLEEIFARFDPDATLQPLPPNYSQSGAQSANTAMMLSSEQTAELVALCHHGYPALCQSGVLIVQVESTSKARGVLRANDLILAVDGTRVATPDQLRAALEGHPAGALLQVTIQRGTARLTVAVRSMAAPKEVGRAILGVDIDPDPAAVMPAKLPIDLKINAGDIGGPSAGLMFTLGILDRLSPTDLTHGCTVAGTGTINLDSTVGAIGGVKQKVIGAQWAGARYFFVPYDGGNYDDARKVVGSHITLLPVHTLDDALHDLAHLPTCR